MCLKLWRYLSICQIINNVTWFLTYLGWQVAGIVKKKWKKKQSKIKTQIIELMLMIPYVPTINNVCDTNISVALKTWIQRNVWQQINHLCENFVNLYVKISLCNFVQKEDLGDIRKSYFIPKEWHTSPLFSLYVCWLKHFRLSNKIKFWL